VYDGNIYINYTVTQRDGLIKKHVCLMTTKNYIIQEKWQISHTGLHTAKM